MQFMVKVNPNTQVAFASHPDKAIMGDYPTLNDINAAYGRGFAAEWIIPQLANLTSFTGAKNITEVQQEELARIIASEYKFLKVTELLLFFYNFKTGKYGRFYGTFDPMVITCALRDFMKERSSLICEYMRIKENEKQEEERNSLNDTLTREEWEEIKTIQAMYEMRITKR